MTFETPKSTTAVILGFKTPSSTNSQISPPERYDEHPRTRPGGYFPHKWRILFDKEIKLYSP